MAGGTLEDLFLGIVAQSAGRWDAERLHVEYCARSTARLRPNVPAWLANLRRRGMIEAVPIPGGAGPGWTLTDRGRTLLTGAAMERPDPVPAGLVATVHRAGFEILGTRGTFGDVRSVWRAFLPASAVPGRLVPESDDDADRLATAWADLVAQTSLVSETGELLLGVEAHGPELLPWLHVRVLPGRDPRIEELGRLSFCPSFVASDLGRTVALGVDTGEYGYAFFVSRTAPDGSTPVPTAGTGTDTSWWF